MGDNRNTQTGETGPVLVLGGTGKTGRRVAERLRQRGVQVRIGSRSASPAFDWSREEGWDACLEGIQAVYITLAPDLAVPGSTDLIQAFCERAERHGVKRLVLLSGRGEAEAQACERIVQAAGPQWTIVRASWFHQNFSEGAFLDLVRAGQITLPIGDVGEPFIDADDIADVAVATLTEEGHAGEVYEVTGPRLMTFADVAAEISSASGRDVQFVQIPHAAFLDGVKASGAPQEVVWMMDYLFATVLDGRNAHLTDGVERALGRQPKDFADYARDVAATGAWRAEA
ncbi:MAG: NAD(P)H-binding protein [Pseudomonadota bacterium]